MGMRVLLTTTAGLGHIHPMVPLARAMAARGHDVLWAAPADGVGHVERTGIRAVATSPPGLTRPADVRRRYPEFDSLPPVEVPDAMFGKLFDAIAAPAMLAELVPVALEWRPNLVVADAAELVTRSPLPLPDARSEAPLVYVTMGTVFNSPELFQVVLAALGELDVRVLVTIGPQADPAILGAQPAHVRVERYVPQTLVLPHCHVVVSHAGSGTVLSTLTLGLPQLCLSQAADQFLNAVAVASADAASR